MDATVADTAAVVVAAVAALRRTIDEAEVELDRIDSLVGAAEAVSATVDSASRLAHAAFSTPVIKGLAAANGAGKAVRRLKTGANGKG